MARRNRKRVYCLVMNSKPAIPRYSSLAFPPYTFIPGENPHPTRDPDGHSYGKEEHEKIVFDPEQWQQCQQYLYGIDLFNHGYWWEAHEALEAVWIAAGRTTPTGYFIQGLIQVAVAQLKQQQSFTDVAQRMAADGLDKMHLVNTEFLGINVPAFRARVKEFIRQPETTSLQIELEFQP